MYSASTIASRRILTVGIQVQSSAAGAVASIPQAVGLEDFAHHLLEGVPDAFARLGRRLDEEHSVFARKAHPIVSRNFALFHVNLVAYQHLGHCRSGAVDFQFVQPRIEFLEGALLVGVVHEDGALRVSIWD